VKSSLTYFAKKEEAPLFGETGKVRRGGRAIKFWTVGSWMNSHRVNERRNEEVVSRVRFALIPPLIALIVLLVIWEGAIRMFGIKSYFLPSPWEVLLAAWRIRGELAGAVWLTGRAAISGFFLSLVIGSVIAMIFAQSGHIRLGCFPYAVLLQTVPIVAIAPLVINWQGAGLQSVILISFVVSLFPIIANVTAGLMSVDRQLVELFRMGGANWWQEAIKLRVPHAVADLVTGARTSAGLAVIGAIVGEFFTGNSTSQHGLGFLIPQRIHWLKTDEAFAAVAMATLLGVVMFGAVGWLRSTVLARWCDARG
jgi:NitT/TauT family transport system permease protein